MARLIALPHRGVLRISGEDRVAFLQGLVTNDVTRASPGKALYACLLTPQGKFLYDMFLFADAESLWMDSCRARLPELVKRLTLYTLRSKVVIEDKSADYAVYASHDVLEMPLSSPDPRMAEMGWRGIDGVGRDAENVTSYHAWRLQHGVPESDVDLIPESSLMLEARMDALHAVDFHKGCYVGQEVTARSKHRATLRKKLYAVRGMAPLPPADTEIMLGDKLAGHMRSSQGEAGLALLRVEEAEQGAPLNALGQNLNVFHPEWMV